MIKLLQNQWQREWRSLRCSKQQIKKENEGENKKLLSLLYNYNRWSNIPKESIKEIV